MKSQKNVNKKPSKINQSLIVRIGKLLRPYINRIIARYSVIPDKPVFTPSDFPFTKLLENNWEIIRKEAQAVITGNHEAVPRPLKEISPDHGRIAADDRWKSFFLIGYGYKANDNCQYCPETTKILEQIPGINSGFFSIMEANGHIPRHKGVTKAILTCHLGLMVPHDRQKCYIQIENETHYWEAGKTMVFDDTYDHEVWNKTNEDRVVLLIQFRRAVRFPGNFFASFFLEGVRMSPFVQTARKRFHISSGKSTKFSSAHRN